MSLNNNETPMLHRFWQENGGTLIEEFYAVRHRPGHSERRIDGVIIKGGETAIKRQNKVEIAGQDIIVVQVKTGRLGMYVMGQGLFSARLMQRFEPNQSSRSFWLKRMMTFWRRCWKSFQKCAWSLMTWMVCAGVQNESLSGKGSGGRH